MTLNSQQLTLLPVHGSSLGSQSWHSRGSLTSGEVPEVPEVCRVLGTAGDSGQELPPGAQGQHTQLGTAGEAEHSSAAQSLSPRPSSTS